MTISEHEREFRLVTEDSTIFIELCEDGQAVYRVPMAPHDAIEFAKALVVAVAHVRAALSNIDIQ